MLDYSLAVAACYHSAVALEMLAGKQAEKGFYEFHGCLLILRFLGFFCFA
jgi:hypothetical protein